MTLIYESDNESGFVKVAGKSYVIKDNKVIVENATDNIKLILNKHSNLKLISETR